MVEDMEAAADHIDFSEKYGQRFRKTRQNIFQDRKLQAGFFRAPRCIWKQMSF